MIQTIKLILAAFCGFLLLSHSILAQTSNYPPTITSQPTNLTVAAGNAATFNVAVSGTGPLTYQWFFNGTNNLSDIITTVAGNGTNGYSGDKGAATNAELSGPCGVTADSSGNLFIADTHNHRIRKVDTHGVINTVAGDSNQGFTGDGVAATNAALNYPEDVVVDMSGNLFIADTYNYRVRKVNTNGIITTVAGNGNPGYSGDGIAATNTPIFFPEGVAVDASGNLFIADFYNARVRKVDTNGIINTVAGNGTRNYSGDGGAATNACLNEPYGVAVDGSGNLFIADGGNSRIREVATNGIIFTVAGNSNRGYSGDGGQATNASLYYPPSVSLDLFGNLFITDMGNNRIREVNSMGIIATIAGGGAYTGDGISATNSSLNSPEGASVDTLGNLFIADNDNNRIRRVSVGLPQLVLSNLNLTNTGTYSVIVSSPYGTVTSSNFTLTVNPFAITSPPTNETVLASNTASLNVGVTGTGPFTYQWFFNGNPLNGSISTVAGDGIGGYSGDGGSAPSAELYLPMNVAVDPFGDFFIADFTNNRIREVNSNGFIFTLAGNGIQGYSGDGGPATNAALNLPSSVALDSLGNLFIADAANNRIREVSASGTITTVAGNGTRGYSGDNNAATYAELYDPTGVAVDSSNNLFIADWGNDRIRKVTTNGTITTVAGNGFPGYSGDGSLATSARIFGPNSMTVDSLGRIFIADTDNSRIREVNTNGIISTFAGNGTASYAGDGGAATNAEIYFPNGVMFDSSHNIYIADSGNNRIRKVNTNGMINTVAGNGNGGYSGDGEPATNASLRAPYGVTVDSSGSLYIADFANNRIRKVSSIQSNLVVAGATAANAGNYYVVISNAYGALTSSIVILSVSYPAPVITSQPTNETVVAGTPASFNVGVSGTGPFVYQWVFNGTNNLAGTITTVAGGGSGSDGVAATNASLYQPQGVAVDGAGNLYIADTFHQRIRKVNTNGMISTLAGNGSTSYSGDGGYATNASLAYPGGVAVDSLGNVFIADTGNNRIRKVGTNGVITNVAGNGNYSYSGDGGLATNSALNYPSSVAVDSIGNLFIADNDDLRIRKVFTSGIISTYAGNGTNGFSGDGGTATNARVSFPWGASMDSFGNLFIADTDNNRIREVYSYGNIATVAGSGSSSFSGDGGAATNAAVDNPYCAAVDAFGNIFVADTLNNRIREITTNGIITTVAGGGTTLGDGGLPTNAMLSHPDCVAVDASGNLFIADTFHNRIRKVAALGPQLVIGNPSLTNAGTYALVVTTPYGSVTSSVVTLTVESPPIITSQPSNETILPGGTATFNIGIAGTGPFTYQWYFNGTNSLDGIITTVAGGGEGGDGGFATNATLFIAMAVALDPQGEMFIADYENNRIRKVDSNGIISTFAGDGNRAFAGDGGPATNASLSYPTGVARDLTGDWYIADSGNNRIREVSDDGIMETIAGNGYGFSPYGLSGIGGPATNAALANPQYVAIDLSGNVLISDGGYCCIWSVATNGIISIVAGLTNGCGYSGDGGPATNAALSEPWGITMDSCGNLFIADAGNNCIRKVNTNGIITTVAGNEMAAFSGDGGAATNASLNNPEGVGVDASGNIFIADTDNNSIREVFTNGIITTVAGYGNPNESYGGDGGPATAAGLAQPFGVTVDLFDNIFIADTANSRIRKVTQGQPQLVIGGAGLTNVGTYSVVISNAYGSVTSSMVHLTVPFTPQLLSASYTNGGAMLNLFTTAFTNNRVLAATNLVPPVVWSPIWTNTNGGYWSFIDTNLNAGSQKFYRVSTP